MDKPLFKVFGSLSEVSNVASQLASFKALKICEAYSNASLSSGLTFTVRVCRMLRKVFLKIRVLFLGQNPRQNIPRYCALNGRKLRESMSDKYRHTYGS